MKYTIGISCIFEDGVSSCNDDIDFYDTEDEAHEEIAIESECCDTSDWYVIEINRRSDGDWYDNSGNNISQRLKQ